MREQGESGMMTTMRGSEAVNEQVLVDRARRGDRSAFETLYQQHASAAWRLARAVTRQPDRAADAVIGAFRLVLAPSNRVGVTRHEPIRLQLLAATRQIAGDAPLPTPTSAQAHASLPDLTQAAADSATLEIFDRLPERCRSVLWLTEVETMDASGAGAVVGLSAASATQLAQRAGAALREQFAHAQLRSATTPDCKRTTERLGGYVTSNLPRRDATRVRRHLDRCGACRDRLDAMDDLTSGLRRSAVPLPVVVFPAAEQAWAAGTAAAAGPLGLTLPSGQPLPAWAERVLVGATAAVITVGITGASLFGGRGGNGGAGQVATNQPISSADGESALGGANRTTSDGPIGDGGNFSSPPANGTGGDGTLGTPSSDANASPVSPRASGEAPRTGGGPLAPVPPSPGTTAPAGPRPDTPSPDTPPAAKPPVATVRVDDSTGLSVGGGCTGVEVLDIVIGCEPSGVSTLPIGPLLP